MGCWVLKGLLAPDWPALRPMAATQGGAPDPSSPPSPKPSGARSWTASRAREFGWRQSPKCTANTSAAELRSFPEVLRLPTQAMAPAVNANIPQL